VFQEHLQLPGNYFHELTTDQLSNASQDLIVAGTYFNDSLVDPAMEVMRIDEINGGLIWQKTYYDNTNALVDIRIFDIVTYNNGGSERIGITGSVSMGGNNYLYIAKLDENGSYLGGSYYMDLIPGTVHSQGLNIIYSQQGFVVGGFTNMDYSLSNVSDKSGFVMKTDTNFNPMWTKMLVTNHPTAIRDYDMVSDITETDDGYFVTGSLTCVPFSTQQGVMCLKLNYAGNVMWTQSYVYGNSQDIGVDAYYDASTDEIYLLANYSASHYFGVTLLDDNTGSIDASRTWRAYDWNELNRYGFKIMASADTANLVVTGYMTDGMWIDETGSTVFSKTVPFVYEFMKSNGDQVGPAFYYHVPHTDPGFVDYFDFWYGQLPLIYYPEMSLKLHNSNEYFHLAYRTDAVNGFTNIEMIKTDFTHRNHCFQSPLALNHDPVVPTFIPLDTIVGSPTAISFTLTEMINPYVMDSSCYFGPPPPPPCNCDSLAKDVAMGFTPLATGITVNFTPNSLKECDSVQWTFGDGNTGNSQAMDSITHTYATSGSYQVCMYVTRYTNDGFVCSDSVCMVIDIFNVGTDDHKISDLVIYPNPASANLHIKMNAKNPETRYNIYNSMGIMLEGRRIEQETTIIDVSTYPSGIYFVRIQRGADVFVEKVLVD
jgi:hypothetical protein